MDRLAKKVALRHIAAAKGAEQLLLEDLDPEKVEVYVQGLVDSLDDLEGVEKELGLDLRNLTQLLDKWPHNDDIHHSGETTLQHMKWVIEDLQQFTGGMDVERRRMLQLAALLHDLGKAYTYELIEGKHTFRQHAKISVRIAEKMLAKLREKNAKFVQRILDLVRLHDSFMQLIDARESSTGTHYLNKLMREAIYTDGHLDDLVTLSKADGHRAERMQETLAGMDGVLADLREVDDRRRQEAEAMQRRRDVPPEVIQKVRAILERGAPELVHLLPDIKAVKGQLGKDKRYDLLKLIGQVQ